MKALGVLILLIIWLVGCARHVVVKPEELSSLNDADWKIISKPSKTILERADVKDKGENHKADTN